MKTCTKCHIEKSLDSFWLVTRNDGRRALGAVCKVCKAAYKKINEAPKRKQISEQARQKTILIKQQLVDTFNSKCAICNGKFHQSAFDFHHVIGKKNTRGVSAFLQSKLETALVEANKCIMVCSNCHRFLHSVCNDIYENCKIRQGSLEANKTYLIGAVKDRYDKLNA